MVRKRVRIRFRKQGDLRWIGHRDLVRAVERLLRRAGLKLAMSEGFHPKPRMSFPSALPVGIEGRDEVMEIELAETTPAHQLAARLAPLVPPGLALERIDPVPEGSRKPQLRSATYRIAVPPDRREEAALRIEAVRAAAEVPILRAGRTEPIDLKEFLEAMELDGQALEFRLRIGRGASPGPRDVLAVLGLDDVERGGGTVARTRVELVP